MIQDAKAGEVKTYEYRVSRRNVLGINAYWWSQLDWRGVRRDDGFEIDGVKSGEYLHVRCIYDRDHDGPNRGSLKDRRWERVYCRHYIGSKWRGGVVVDVKVKKRKGNWYWIVHVEKP